MAQAGILCPTSLSGYFGTTSKRSRWVGRDQSSSQRFASICCRESAYRNTNCYTVHHCCSFSWISRRLAVPTQDITERCGEVRTHSALRAWWLCKARGYRIKLQVKSDPVPTAFRRIRYKKTWVLELPASAKGSNEKPTTEQNAPRLENEGFKRCSVCGFLWPTRASLLSDVNVQIIGYRAHFEQLLTGLFLFNHSCGNTIALEASHFQDLYEGPVFAEPLTGSDACPGYCLYENELLPCPAECECAYVREIIQVVKNWPEAERK